MADNDSQRRPDETLKAYIARKKAAEFEKKNAEYQSWQAEKEKERRDSLAADTDVEPGQVSSNESSKVANLPVQSASQASQHSSQGTESTAQDLLQKFGGRQEPLNKTSVLKTPAAATKKAEKQASSTSGKKPADEAFLGFGHVDATGTQEQRAATTQPKPNADKNQTAKKASNSSQPKSTKASEARHSEDSSSGRDKPPKKAASTPQNTKAVAARATTTPKNATAASHARWEPASAPAQPASAIGKRPAATNPSVHERKISLGALPKIQKKTSVASTQSPDRADSAEASDNGIITANEERPPRWYKTQAMATTRNRDEADVLTLLQRLKTAIANRDIVNVRDCLVHLPYEQVNKSLVRSTRMLDNDGGLRLLFDFESLGGRAWPYDISADAKELYNRWCRQIFEVELMRGILLPDKMKKRTTEQLDKSYTGRVDFRAFGNNDLSNGQWFPTQLTTIRDGAHGHTQGGISGKTGEGAYSCIMTGVSGYPDRDNGDEVFYCGTDSDNGIVTKNTQLLLDNITNHHPVRLIRKSTLGTKWAPEVGYRYDGLYDVVSFEILNAVDAPKAARHRFRLVRCTGQDPLRGTGEGARPTWKEVEKFREKKLARG